MKNFTLCENQLFGHKIHSFARKDMPHLLGVYYTDGKTAAKQSNLQWYN